MTVELDYLKTFPESHFSLCNSLTGLSENLGTLLHCVFYLKY